MIKFEVNMSDTFEEFLMTKSQAEAMTKTVLNDITRLFAKNWRAHAKNVLFSTRRNYMNGIIVVDRGRLENAVILQGTFNNMLEFGFSAFDMKEGFKKSQKVKKKLDGGWFLTIPFRLGVPTTLGESEAFSGILPTEVHSILKKRALSNKVAYGTDSTSGIKLSDLPTKLQTTGKREAIPSLGEAGKEYIHKHSIFEGVQRFQKTYESATQSTYRSFRRVSDKSSPNSWIHRGIKAYQLAERAFNTTDFDTQVDNSMDKYLASIGHGD